MKAFRALTDFSSLDFALESFSTTILFSGLISSLLGSAMILALMNPFMIASWTPTRSLVTLFTYSPVSLAKSPSRIASENDTCNKKDVEVL